MVVEAFLDLSEEAFYPGVPGRDDPDFCFGVSVSQLLEIPALWSPQLTLRNVKHHFDAPEKWYTVSSSGTGIYYKYKFKACMVTQLQLRLYIKPCGRALNG